jgi:hypothetical protein
MTISIILHLTNEDPVVAELEELPNPSDQIIVINNPRLKDGKDLHYLEAEVTMMIVPWHRITFIEVVPSAEMDEVITFVREE